MGAALGPQAELAAARNAKKFSNFLLPPSGARCLSVKGVHCLLMSSCVGDASLVGGATYFPRRAGARGLVGLDT